MITRLAYQVCALCYRFVSLAVPGSKLGSIMRVAAEFEHSPILNGALKVIRYPMSLYLNDTLLANLPSTMYFH